MNDIWTIIKDALPKIFSDRLWALLAFLVLVLVNAIFDLGLEHAPVGQDSTIVVTMYAVVAFILGKSIRGTVGGSILKQGLDILLPAVEKVAPSVEASEPARKPSGQKPA